VLEKLVGGERNHMQIISSNLPISFGGHGMRTPQKRALLSANV